MQKFDLQEVKDFIAAQSPETKVYLGADSERINVRGKWYADYTLAVVVHIDGNHGFKYVTEDIFEWSKKIKKGFF